MKKVLSLILVCTMVLSFAFALNVSAAGEGYTITAGKVAQQENEDTGDMETVFTADSFNTVAVGSTIASTQIVSLKITTNTAASGGYIAIDYDETKVMPVRYNSTFSKAFDSFSDTNYMNFATAGTGVTTTASKAATYPDTDLGAVVYTWTGAMSADATIAYLHFACKEGVTTDNFDKDTFKLASDETFMTKYKLGNGGASLDYKGTTYKLNDSTLTASLTYPNSDKSAGGDEPVDWKTTVTTDKPADATSDDAKFEYRTDAKDPTKIGTEAPAKRVVVFAKNTTGAPLSAQTYGVTFGRSFYPGVADVPVDSYWSIILVDTDGTFLTQDSYSYTAKVGSVEAAAGNVTVQTAE